LPREPPLGAHHLGMRQSLTTDASDWINLNQSDQEYPALGKRYFQRLIAERRIPYYKPNGPRGRVLLRRSDIEAFIEATRREPVGAA
jgi:excisionase family DNA binding protein